MECLRFKRLIELLITVLLFCTACGEDEPQQTPLIEGLSYELTSVTTGFDSDYGGTGLYPWLKFTIMNNGTESIETLRVVIEMVNPAGELLYQSETTRHNVDSRRGINYEYQSMSGWSTDNYYQMKNSGLWHVTYSISVATNGGALETVKNGYINFVVEDY